MSEILLGYEVGSGAAVYVPYAHTVVCGQTQASGKTTTLEALLSRTGEKPRPALAFVTKRAEGAFIGARRIPPYFRDRADWQFVESILEAMMRERMKYERQWIIRVCQGATSLEQVAANVEAALHGDGKKHQKAATGFAAGMYLQLSEYFKLLMPELKRLKMDMAMHGSKLTLEPGLNVMDLSEYSTEMQSLAIASAMEEVYRMRNVVTVIPEAWEFIPQGRNTPVKMAGIALIRKGAAGHNFMWLDSQDISGVEKSLLKQVGVWILGVQREINEVEHTLSQMGVPKKLKPKPEDVMQLRRGQFFVCFENVLKRVYVRPRWMPEKAAIAIAKHLPGSQGENLLSQAVHEWQPQQRPEGKDRNVDYKAAFEEAQQTILRLEAQVRSLSDTPRETAARAGNHQPQHSNPVQDEVTIALDVKKPELQVTVRRYTVEIDDESTRGRLAILIWEGFLDKARRTQDLIAEFRQRGWMAQTGRPIPLNIELAKLAEMGFVRINEGGTYQGVPGMKVNVKEVKTVA